MIYTNKLFKLSFFTSFRVLSHCFLICITFGSLELLSYSQKEIDDDYLNLFSEVSFLHSEADFSYSMGDYIGLNHSYFQMAYFSIFSNIQGVSPFVDSSFYRLNDSRCGGTLGLGVRKIVNQYSIAGINLFCDGFSATSSHALYRISLGLEWLNSAWDFRVNLYLPLGPSELKGKKQNYEYPGGYIVAFRDKEYGLSRGFDSEIGVPIGSAGIFDLYVAAGPYYYGYKKQIYFCGAFTRFEFKYQSLFSINFNSSYDQINNLKFQVEWILSLPFELIFGKTKDFLEASLLKSVQRNRFIYTKGCSEYEWNW